MIELLAELVRTDRHNHRQVAGDRAPAHSAFSPCTG
jgi:hypothetical protein